MIQTRRKINRPLSRAPGSHKQSISLGVIICIIITIILTIPGIVIFVLLNKNESSETVVKATESTSSIRKTAIQDVGNQETELKLLSTDKEINPNLIAKKWEVESAKSNNDLIAKKGEVESAKRNYEGKDNIILITPHGSIKVRLRPDLSLESTQYLHEVIQSRSCPKCKFYRAESDGGILQGIIRNPSIGHNTVRGPCPEGGKESKKCPEWDKNCGCHGPVMTRGMIGWAGGGAGPDFFINVYKWPATWWENQHTVWGEINDEQSFAVVGKILSLDATSHGGMTYLDEEVHFTLDYDEKGEE